MPKYICIHGHFYQPPRENPGLESIERQDSAHPFHDWNERVTAECYAPNAAARILDDRDHIARICNNYSRISFNFGPTLLTWLEHNNPEVYARILAADTESSETFSGHGSALAQAYNHVILPLSSRRDKQIQIEWGIRDFESRFGRRPEGMWLPETAVDLESLEIMAAQGIRFTILAPHQAARIRPKGSVNWTAVPNGSVDITRPYECSLPSGLSIALFFYHGPIARAIAFEGLLKNGQAFLDALRSGLNDHNDDAQLVHIATDGETFGHHHKYGDMALAWALDQLEGDDSVQLTNYGEFLDHHPPAWEVEIHERTAWSCGHGVGRWHTDCGCNSGSHPGFNQRWRAPLREALDFLRSRLLKLYSTEARGLFADPERAFLDYIDVILNRAPDNVTAFLTAHAGHPLSDAEQVAALRLLELQRNAQLMYTSCGWFFDDISGIESVQLLHYAGRAIQLAMDFTDDDLEAKFTGILAGARSNYPKFGDGRVLYQRFVRPNLVDLPRVAANAAILGLFAEHHAPALHCFRIECNGHHDLEMGRARLSAGRLHVDSTITRESATYSCVALHLGDQHAACALEPYSGDGGHEANVKQVAEPFQQSDFMEAIRRLNTRSAPTVVYNVESLFRDEQRDVLARLTDVTLAEADQIYRQLYENHAALMTYFGELGVPIPRAFKTAAELVVQNDLEDTLAASPLDHDRLDLLLKQAQDWDLKLDAAALGYRLTSLINDAASVLQERPQHEPALARLFELVGLLDSTHLKANLWKAQNVFYALLHSTYRPQDGATTATSESSSLGELVAQLAERLKIRLDNSA